MPNERVSILFLLMMGSLLSSFSQEFEWAINMGGVNNDQVMAMTIDEEGNVYATGFFMSDSADFDPGPNESILINHSSAQDVFVAKYNSDGELIWVKSIGSGSTDMVSDIAIDVHHNVYITGYFHGYVDFDPGPEEDYITSVEQNDAYVLKLDAEGNYVWAKTFGGEEWNNGITLEISDSGNVYMAGEYRGIIDLNPDEESEMLADGTYMNAGDEFFVVKLDSSGSFVWGHGFGSAGDDWVFDLIILENEDIVISGVFCNAVDFDPGPDEYIMTTNSYHQNMYLLKLDADATFIWARQYGGPGNVYGSSIEINSKNQFLLTGSFNHDPIFEIDGSEQQFYELSHRDIYVMLLDEAGDISWIKIIETANESGASSVAVDDNDNVFVTGSFRVGADLNPEEEVQWETATDVFFLPYVMFVLKLDSSGTFQWAHAIGENVGVYGRSVAALGAESIYVGGGFGSSQNMAPYPEEYLLNATGAYSHDAYILKWNKEPVPPPPPIGSIFQVYPNPAESYVIVRTEGNRGVLEIISSTGQIIRQIKMGSEQIETVISVSELDYGLYFFRFYNNMVSEVRKFEKI